MGESGMSKENDIKYFVEVNIFCRYHKENDHVKCT